MRYDFDGIIDRRNTNSMNTDGFRAYIFHADETMEFPYADHEFIRMWVADMEFATAPCVVDAIKRRADQRIFGYSKIFDPAYYKAFAAWCERLYGWSFPRKHLVTSNGIIPALYELVGHLTEPDEKVLVMTPSYAYFKHAADFNDRALVCSDLKNDGGRYTMDFNDLSAKAADPKTTLCIFCNPHNPSGRVWTQEELEKVFEICKANGVWIISDEIHCDLLRSGVRHTPLAKVAAERDPSYDRIVTCMATSKTFNTAGLMFSNIIIPNEDLMARWKSRHYDFDNPISIAAAQAAYENGADWLESLKEYLDGNFRFTGEYLAQHLPEAVFRIPEATYLAWVDVGAYVEPGTDLPLFFANNAGVLLEGGDMFVRNSDTFIRLNLAMPRSMLEEGLRRICGLLTKGRV